MPVEDPHPPRDVLVGVRRLQAAQAGDAARARDQYAALLRVRERVSGTEHPDTLAARAHLAYWTEQAGGDAEPGVD